MKHLQFIILCWLLSWAYLAQARIQDRPTQGGDTITVIMQNIPPAQTQLEYCGTKQSVISPFYSSYVNDVGDLIWVKQQGKASDTLRIITKRDIVAWRLVRAGSPASHIYPLARGKVYHLTYDGWLCRSSAPEHEPINTLMRKLAKEVYYQGIASVERFEFPWFGIKEGKKMIKAKVGKELPASHIAQAQKEIDYLYRYLDSLQRTEVSAQVLQYIREYAVAQEMQLSHFTKQLRRYYTEPKEWSNPMWPVIMEEEGVYRMGYSVTQQKSIKDAAEFLKGKGVSEACKRFMLSNLLQHISASVPYKPFRYFAGQYLELYPDSPLPKQLSDSYSYKGEAEDNKEVMLLSPKGERKKLSEVLASCRGSKVVLDVWATWCGPCVMDIKRGQAERSRAKQSGMKYIFIAFQDNEVAWRTQHKELGLDKEEHSYFVLNPDADWFGEHKVKSLPTKLYYNASGTLVDTQVGLRL